MKTSFAVAVILAASAAVASPLGPATVDGLTVDESEIPYAAPNEEMQQAAANWMKDTGIVSNWLNIAATLKGDDYTRNAQIALDAEKNELTHKAILDKIPKITRTQAIQSANNSLATEGHFQAVVDALADMVKKGPSVAVSDRDAINANRCVNVLPAIDAYLEAAGTPFRAVRPTVCDATGVKPGQPGSSAPAPGQGNNGHGHHNNNNNNQN